MNTISNHVYIELNNIYAEYPLFNSTFVVERNAQIKFECQAIGYESIYVTMDVAAINKDGYNLENYLNEVNNKIIDNTFFNYKNIRLDVNSSAFPTFSIELQKIISDYTVTWNTNLELNEKQFIQSNNKNDTTFNSNNISTSNVYVLRHKDALDRKFSLLTLTPNNNTTSNFPVLEIPFSFSDSIKDPYGNPNYESFNKFFDDFKNSILNYEDISGSKPLNQSIINYVNVSEDSIIKYQINIKLVIAKTLTQKDFKLTFLESSLIDYTESSWKKNLKFSESYNLSSKLNENGVAIITADKSIDKDMLTLKDGVNNYFSFIPATTSVGLYTTVSASTQYYTGQQYNDIYVRIPCATDSQGNPIDTNCNNEVLFRKMNTAFQSDTRTKGTYIQQIYVGDKIYCKLRVNINFAFTAEDYIIDFYDVENFVNCYIGAQSVRNTTWDNTLGWLLGFHEQNSYPLYEFYNPLLNACIFTGDTSVNTNLYSTLFLTLDDYNQNRLNDGVITIAKTDSKPTINSYANLKNQVCYSQDISFSSYSNLTPNKRYALQEVLKSQKNVEKQFSTGPYLKDVFAVIDFKIPSKPGDPITEFGGSLQNQNRLYFGPVNIRRLNVQLYTDKGNLLDLNNNEWTFKLICEQLYQKQITSEK